MLGSSRFDAMVVYLQFCDTQQHNKPHVHVFCGNDRASVGFDGKVLAGSLPCRWYRILNGWLAKHEEGLYASWNKAVRSEHFDKIRPAE